MASVNSTLSPSHNLTHLPFPPVTLSPSWQAEASKWTQVVAVLLIFLVGVPLNGLVVWALGWQARRRLRHRGRETRSASSFRVYVFNLALADLLLLFRTPLMLGYIAYNYSWPFGITLCRLVMFLRGLGLYASAFLLCAVALERCLCLLRPLWARLHRPSWAVPLACGLLWVVAAALAAPYLHTAVLAEKYNTLQCMESGTPSMGLFVIDTVAGFILPLLVFMGSNVAVLLTVGRISPAATPSSSRRMVRMYHVLFFTVLLFLTCWVPYFTCRFLRALAAGKADLDLLYGRATRAAYISLYLVYIKSAFNPVLYVFAARGLGGAIKASIISTIEKVFDDSESIRRKSLKNGNNSQALVSKVETTEFT